MTRRDVDSRLVDELERRLEELESLDDAAFGRFTKWDWLFVLLTSLVLPYLVFWWLA